MSPGGATVLSNTELLSQEFEKRERKREQNRIAQRTYRLNQKRRIRALETAVKQSSHTASPPKPPASQGTRLEGSFTPIHQRSDSMLSVNSGDVSESVATASIPGGVSPQPEPWLVTLGLDPCHISVAELAGVPRKRTPLQIAIQNKNTSLVQLLLQEGADIARKDQDGSTALHLAVESGQEDIVSAILNRGIDPNEPDYSGRTALSRAVEVGDRAIARLLLDSDSDPNLKDMWGNTALHLAVEANSEILAQLLLDYGAHIDP